MEQFTQTDMTDLESAGTSDTLLSRLDRMFQSSTTVQARVERLDFETGEYCVVLRGVLVPNGTEEPAELDAGESIPY